MKKEVQKKESDMDIVPIPMDEIENEFTENDIKFPKLWLMQGLSDAVVLQKAKIGDFWTTHKNEVVNDVTFTPIYMKKVCFVSKKLVNEKKFKFSHTFPVVTRADEMMKWEETIGNEQTKREYAYIFFVLLKGHEELPHMITFKSTHYNTGKDIATQMYVTNKMVTSAIYYPSLVQVKLTSRNKTNDDGTYAVPLVEFTEVTDKIKQQTAGNWYKVIKSMGSIELNDGPPELPKEENNAQEQY